MGKVELVHDSRPGRPPMISRQLPVMLMLSIRTSVQETRQGRYDEAQASKTAARRTTIHLMAILKCLTATRRSAQRVMARRKVAESASDHFNSR